MVVVDNNVKSLRTYELFCTNVKVFFMMIFFFSHHFFRVKNQIRILEQSSFLGQ